MKSIWELNIAAYEAIRKNIRAGATEIDVYNTVSKAFDKLANRSVHFVCDIISGERGAGVEGQPTDSVLLEGDALIVDILPEYGGVYSDTTRTFFIGMPTEKHKNVYAALLEALRAGEREIREGQSADRLYTIVRDSIDRSGFRGLFPHHAGHRVGMECLMEPDFVEGNQGKLEAGMIVTLEPGIYIPGHFGIRLEDNYLVTETGYEKCYDYPLDIEYFILK